MNTLELLQKRLEAVAEESAETTYHLREDIRDLAEVLSALMEYLKDEK